MQQIFIHQSLLSPCLTNSKRRYFYQFKQYRHRINASLFQLRKGEGAAPYSKVIFRVRLSCVIYFKSLISAYLTTVGQNTLIYTLNHSVGLRTHFESAVHRCSVLLRFSAVHISVKVLAHRVQDFHMRMHIFIFIILKISHTQKPCRSFHTVGPCISSLRFSSETFVRHKKIQIGLNFLFFSYMFLCVTNF